MSKSNYVHLATRIFNTPVAILPQKGEVIVATIGNRFGILHDFSAAPMMMEDDDFAGGQYGKADEDCEYGYNIVSGCAVIEISGTLVQKNGYLKPHSGMTGYDGIRQNFLHALENPAVTGVVLDINSGGGEVSGCFDLVDTIYEARGSKPIAAILNESAYSAAYAIASAADFITVPRTGGVGSVGVIRMHVDYSKGLKKDGIKVTMVTYGNKKGHGNPFEPFADEALRDAQNDVDMMGEMFVELVARNRRISVDDVRATQAGTFLGQEGVDIGFADELLSPHLAFTKFVDTID